MQRTAPFPMPITAFSGTSLFGDNNEPNPDSPISVPQENDIGNLFGSSPSPTPTPLSANYFTLPGLSPGSTTSANSTPPLNTPVPLPIEGPFFPFNDSALVAGDATLNGDKPVPSEKALGKRRHVHDNDDVEPLDVPPSSNALGAAFEAGAPTVKPRRATRPRPRRAAKPKADGEVASKASAAEPPAEPLALSSSTPAALPPSSSIPQNATPTTWPRQRLLALIGIVENPLDCLPSYIPPKIPFILAHLGPYVKQVGSSAGGALPKSQFNASNTVSACASTSGTRGAPTSLSAGASASMSQRQPTKKGRSSKAISSASVCATPSKGRGRGRPRKAPASPSAGLRRSPSKLPSTMVAVSVSASSRRSPRKSTATVSAPAGTSVSARSSPRKRRKVDELNAESDTAVASAAAAPSASVAPADEGNVVVDEQLAMADFLRELQMQSVEAQPQVAGCPVAQNEDFGMYGQGFEGLPSQQDEVPQGSGCGLRLPEDMVTVDNRTMPPYHWIAEGGFPSQYGDPSTSMYGSQLELAGRQVNFGDWGMQHQPADNFQAQFPYPPASFQSLQHPPAPTMEYPAYDGQSQGGYSQLAPPDTGPRQSGLPEGNFFGSNVIPTADWNWNGF